MYIQQSDLTQYLRLSGMKKLNSGIYIIKNIKTNKSYIGSAKDLKVRKRLHFSQLRNNKHSNTHLQRSFNKYGEMFFKFETLYFCPEEYLLKLEQKCIDVFKPIYNIRKVATSNLGLKWNNKTKYKISNTLKNKYRNGYCLSKEARHKISEAHKGKKFSNDTKDKISKSLIGNKNCLGKKNSLGYKHTEETKEKIRNSNKGKQYTLGYKHNEISKLKMAKSHYKIIIQLDKINKNFIKEWISIKDAANALGISRSGISDVLRGSQKTCGGFIWKHKHEYI